jgi:hypothetical protein
MKKYFLGALTGFIVCTMLVSAVAIANSPISLIVNGNVVESDVPPQIIDGRTMIPARPLAEALGAKVEWDEENYAVVVTGGVQAGAVPTDLEPVNSNLSEPINNIAEGNGGDVGMEEWVHIREISGRYGISVTWGGDDDMLTLKKDDFYFEMCYHDLPTDEATYIANTSKGELRIKRIDNRTFFNTADLKNIGLIQ